MAVCTEIQGKLDNLWIIPFSKLCEYHIIDKKVNKGDIEIIRVIH